MSFWKPAKTKKREPRPPDTGKAIPAKKKTHRVGSQAYRQASLFNRTDAADLDPDHDNPRTDRSNFPSFTGGHQ